MERIDLERKITLLLQHYQNKLVNYQKSNENQTPQLKEDLAEMIRLVEVIDNYFNGDDER